MVSEGKKKKFHKRWVQLKDNMLTVYKEQNVCSYLSVSTHCQKGPKLAGLSIQLCSAKASVMKRFTFDVTHPDGTFHFTASSMPGVSLPLPSSCYSHAFRTPILA